MTDKWKERIEKVVIGLVVSVLAIMLAAILKGESLKGLTKFSGLIRVLTITVPLWWFLIVLLVAVVSLLLLSKKLKPTGTLHVVWQPHKCNWHLGSVAGIPAMQLMLSGMFTNSDKQIHLIIRQVYLDGTRIAHGLLQPVIIPPEACVEKDLYVFVQPVVAENGKTYRGNLILVDQFNRKHKVPVEMSSV